MTKHYSMAMVCRLHVCLGPTSSGLQRFFDAQGQPFCRKNVAYPANFSEELFFSHLQLHLNFYLHNWIIGRLPAGCTLRTPSARHCLLLFVAIYIYTMNVGINRTNRENSPFSSCYSSLFQKRSISLVFIGR